MASKVIVCEPYFTGSHRGWAEGLASHSTHDVRLVTHGGGFWKWRMQGAALTLAAEIETLVATWGQPDALLVSDMVHLPALLGFARGALGDAAVVLYLHENQLTYPARADAPADETYAMINWLSIAAADRVVFNSEHHRRDVLAAAPRLLRRFPDHRHTAALAGLEERSAVLPVGIAAERFAGDGGAGARAGAVAGARIGEAVAQGDEAGPPVVLWNHRWEYDKDPVAFFAALGAVAERGVDFRLILAGECYQTVPPEFEEARRTFADRLVWFGMASDEDYPGLLRRSDVVVSTARHEFFGVAVVEAVSAGALPLLPDRLSYPELVPDPAETYLYADAGDLVAKLCRALTDHPGRRDAAALARKHVEQYDWRHVAPRYDTLLSEEIATARSRSRRWGPAPGT